MTDEPIAIVSGYFGGRCVVQALDPSVVLPAGMALYATPQPVVPEGYVLVQIDDLKAILSARKNGFDIDYIEHYISDLLSAGEESFIERLEGLK
jgi:hypothetical protein